MRAAILGIATLRDPENSSEVRKLLTNTMSRLSAARIPVTQGLIPQHFRARCRLNCTVGRQGKTKSGPAQGRIVVRSNVTLMGFYNGPADRQAHAHTRIFCCEETFKKTGKIPWINSGPTILNRAAHRIRVRQHGSNKDLAATGLRHRLDGVDCEIHNHLLKLDAVANNLEEVPVPGRAKRKRPSIGIQVAGRPSTPQ